MRTRIYFLAACSALAMSAVTFTACSNNDGTDSFRESLDLPEKKDRDTRSPKDSTDYEKNYPGDSI